MLDIIKQLCFFGTLAIASSIDVKRKTVPTVILLSLFLTGWINISLQSVAGFFCALIPVGITGILRQDLGGRGCETLRPVRVGYGDYGIAVFDHWNADCCFRISDYLETKRQERGDTSSTIY